MTAAEPTPWAGAPWPRRYAALGDSLSAGAEGETVDPWPRRVASALAADGRELGFRNLARAGATSTDVAIWQLQEAVDYRPDLVSLLCGANDVLLSVRPDPDAFGAVFEEILGTLRRRLPDACVVTATYPRVAALLPVRERTGRRIEEGMEGVNAHIRAVAGRQGAVCLEWAHRSGVDDPENFAADGLHPSAIGHGRIATAFEAALRDRIGLVGAGAEGAA